MESVKKWLAHRTVKKNGLYVHYSPPKLVSVVSAAQLRQWARGGAEGKLERAVLAGQGRRLLAEAEALPLARHLPALVARCDALHAAVEGGSLLQLQQLLDSDYNRRKTVMCCDEAGVGLLHKAIYYDYMDIAEWLVEHYPQLVHQKDSEGRTPLHYAGVCRRAGAAAALLERAGAARGARDAHGRTAAHYRGQARTLLALPAPPPPLGADMARDTKNHPQALVIKRHNIRIWCHDCDMARLQRVVWEGHGTRLLSEVSNQPVVKRFLEAVPYIMNTIREIHNLVVQNDLEGLMKLSGDPVPPQALSSRDSHFMTVLHKAAGLGHTGIVKYIVNRYPNSINDVDDDGRTPLHYAAVVKDDNYTYNTLVGFGADESIVDNKNKTPGYYLNRPQEIDRNIFKTLPEAPRTASSAYPPSWDWKLLDTEANISELNKKTRKKVSSNNNSSSNKSNSTSEKITTRAGGGGSMKKSNTHELIKDLPELDASNNSKKSNENLVDIKDEEENKETDKIDETIIENETGNVSEDKNGDHKIENVDHNTEHGDHDTENENDDHKIENFDHNTENGDHDNEIENDDHEIENVDHRTEKSSVLDNKTDDPENNKTESQEEAIEHDNMKSSEESGKEINTTDEIKNDIPSQNHTKPEEHEQPISDTEEPKQDHHEAEHNMHEKEEDNTSQEENVELKEENLDESEIENAVLSAHSFNRGSVVPLAQHSEEQGKDKTDNNNSNPDEDVKPEDPDYDKEAYTTINHHKEKTEGLNHSDETPIEDHNLQKDANSTIEGNNADYPNEDDDDVKVQGDSSSEYSDTNFRSTAEATDTRSAERGQPVNGRNTQESLIEGIVSGDAEEETQDASIKEIERSINGHVLVVDNEIDPEVTELITSANMEMLAALVLNGEGSRLVGRRSRNLELQAFLDNVPTYMQKINKVHLAAKEGNLRDLQAALDRRKFAIARDPISPNGATPLHVATVFGRTNIVKYLGGRFPETLSAVDFEGRSALHYAAVLPDNGHYFNLLQQLGANSKDLDDNGRSAEDYYKNPALFPFKQILADFDISEEAAKNMLSDKIPEDRASARRVLDTFEALDTLERCYRLLASAKPTRTPLSASSNKATPPLVLGTDQAANGHIDIPIFRTEEGRYLAKSLGDPLIKGLTEVANAKPKDPVAFLASFLQNFPDNEKPRLGTQESNVIVTREEGEVENEHPPPPSPLESVPVAKLTMPPAATATSPPATTTPPVATTGMPSSATMVPASATMVPASATMAPSGVAETVAAGMRHEARAGSGPPPRPIDVVAVEPQPSSSEPGPDAPEPAFSSTNRDEHGQSMLHFAAARAHTRNALFQVLQESDISLSFRDELYRTARDVSIQANVPDNTADIDRWVLQLAARGNTAKIMELLLEGYDHILDVTDEAGVSIQDVVAQRGDNEMGRLLDSIPAFEESRDNLHNAVRRGDLASVRGALGVEGGRTLARAKNAFGRTALHVAVLAQREDVVAYLAQNCPELLKIGDNLERTPLHYAMAVDNMESLSRVLIQAGAKRVLKDIKGRQPSYYFLNKSDILRLKEEEEMH